MKAQRCKQSQAYVTSSVEIKGFDWMQKIFRFPKKLVWKWLLHCIKTDLEKTLHLKDNSG